MAKAKPDAKGKKTKPPPQPSVKPPRAAISRPTPARRPLVVRFPRGWQRFLNGWSAAHHNQQFHIFIQTALIAYCRAADVECPGLPLLLTQRPGQPAVDLTFPAGGQASLEGADESADEGRQYGIKLPRAWQPALAELKARTATDIHIHIQLALIALCKAKRIPCPISQPLPLDPR